MSRSIAAATAIASLVGGLTAGVGQQPRVIRVVDAATGQTIAGAVVTANGREHRTDVAGVVRLDPASGNGRLAARAQGYDRTAVDAPASREVEVRLQPFRAKALYLSVYGVGSRTLRGAALDLIDTTELNALVIDVKGDRGLVPYRSAVRLATEARAQQVLTIPDLPAIVAELRERGVYTIARVVVFKDDLLAGARPELAVRRASGAIFRDRESLAWTDPFSRDVWDYNIAIAAEAAAAGFDEI